MPDQSNDSPASPSSSESNVSGGINANTQGGDLSVGQDLIGRDKTVSSGTYIERVEHYHAAASPEPSASPSIPPQSPVAVPGSPASLKHESGSPFVSGRPLRADEPIFGREDAFRFIANELAKFSSINIVGERRMGKSSLIAHLLGHQDRYLNPQPDLPPLVLARVDLQAHVVDAAHFYGLALRELLDHLPASRSAEARRLQDLRERLYAKPEATYDEFEMTLKQLRDERGLCVRPVLVIDEFEQLLDPKLRTGFPFPEFYNNLRALMTIQLVALVVASRQSLAEEFAAQPGSLTSTFPNYLTPFVLHPLDDAAADELLLQPSDHPLTITEAAQAKRWARGHPCLLQAAGAAWYEAKASQRTPQWAAQRFQELKNQNCRVLQAAQKQDTRSQPNAIRRMLRAVFIGLPLRLGRLAQKIGLKLDDIAAWLIGMVIVIVVVLALLGLLNALDVVTFIKKALGIP